jgi:hypothetical protein
MLAALCHNGSRRWKWTWRVPERNGAMYQSCSLLWSVSPRTKEHAASARCRSSLPGDATLPFSEGPERKQRQDQYKSLWCYRHRLYTGLAPTPAALQSRPASDTSSVGRSVKYEPTRPDSRFSLAHSRFCQLARRQVSFIVDTLRFSCRPVY